MVYHTSYLVRGTVQGVGFRPFVYRLALKYSLQGSVSNTGDGVCIEVYGGKASIKSFVDELQSAHPPLAILRSLDIVEHGEVTQGPANFVILSSGQGESNDVDITRDTALCEKCLQELFDPQNPRYRHPFITCTECGPRYSIIQSMPYDRPATTMAPFPLCPFCCAEYRCPESRRFHTQTICCNACGPRLSIKDSQGVDLAVCDPIAHAIDLLTKGNIVAIKGLGGFHLACRADSAPAVEHLRARKHREEKPLALMVRDAMVAAQYVRISEREVRLLKSPEAPIVICEKQTGTSLCETIAPGLSTLGVMLAYTAVHHLLFDHGCWEALVMTSGNQTDDPMVHEEREAFASLGAIADAFLTFNRDIQVRLDDSITRVIDQQPLIMRRARGYAPEPLPLLHDASGIAACGGVFKTTAALGRGTVCYLSQYISSADHWQTESNLVGAIRHLGALLDVKPLVLVGDLHPEAIGLRIADSLALPYIPVQHHFAHAAACLSEHRIDEKTLCIVGDGTGYGADGTMWGGEFLIANLSTYERVGHLQLMPMPGATASIEYPGRMVMGALFAILGEDVRDLCPWMPFQERTAVYEVLRSGVNCVKTSSMGRLFDALSALLEVCMKRTYEGQPAIEVEGVADRCETGEYQLPLRDEDGVVVVDGSQLLLSCYQDRCRGASVSLVAARFHNTLARTMAMAAKQLVLKTSTRNVCLTGGCFQNAMLAERCATFLREYGLQPLFQRLVPPNDGGISYGQLAIAAAQRAS